MPSAYPDVHLDLQEMSSRQVLKALLEESLQVGVIRPLALPDAVHWVELFREPLVAVLRADHPLAAGSEDGLAIAALAEEPSCSSRAATAPGSTTRSSP